MNIFSRGDHNEEYIQGDILKNETLLILAFMICSLGNTCFDSSEWTNYLGNPQRTAYSLCNGVDTPLELWTIDIPGDFGTPFVIGDTVLVLWSNTSMPMKSEIFLIDVLTGEIFQESGQIGFPSGIFPVGDRIIGVYGENIYEIDPVQGKTSLLAVTPKKSHSYPVVLEDTIIFPTIPAVCLSSDFDVVWTMDTQNPDLNLLSLAADEHIAALLMSENGIPHLFVVDSSTGVLKWVSDPLPAALWVTLGKDALYCGGDYVWAFDQSGLCTWKFEPRERIVSNMVLGPDALYCADGNNLYKVDTNGNLLWEAEWEASPWYYKTYLVGAGNILYCIGNYGEPDLVARSQVVAYNMEDGTMIWKMEFESSHYIGEPPSAAKGILVMGNTGGELIALASDPDLFIQQGDVFLSKGYTEKAINSYKKAQELYIEKGNLDQSQEIEKQIHDLENQDHTTTLSKTPEPTPSDSQQPLISSKTPEPTPVPSSLLPESSTLVYFSLLFAIALIGVLLSYYILRLRKS